MRPLKLVMTGFGPYMEKTAIDFESLGRGGMYLITGDTGSGKTYIFDAITFALYGEMSGSSRDSSTARSQYAEDGVATETELEFEFRDKRYKIVRNPEYIRRKKSGEGYTKQTAGAVLTWPDGSVTDGASKVTEAVKDLLGIDRSQFCSIAMIAQGEFRKLLTAGTEERQRLFRKLFNTQPYNRLMEELSEQSKAVRSELENTERELRAALIPVSCSFDDDIAERLEAAREKGFSEASADEIRDILTGLAEKGKELSDEISKDLADADEKLKELNSKLTLAKQKKESEQSLEDRITEVPALDDAIDDARRASDDAASKLPNAEKLEGEAAALDSVMDSYDELDAESAGLDSLEKLIEEKEKALSDIKADRAKLALEISEFEKELKDLRSAREQLERLKAEIQNTENRIETLNALQSEIGRTAELEAVYKKLREEYSPLEDKASGLEIAHIELRSAYMKEQAGILASELAEGDACPVCGSTHHPAPAKLSTDAPTADDVETAEKEAKAARKKSSDKLEEVQKAKGSFEEAKISACTASLRDLGEEDLAKALQLAEAELLSLNGSLKSMLEDKETLSVQRKRAEDIESSLPDMKDREKAYASDIESMTGELGTLTKDAAAAKAKTDTLRSRLEYGSKSEAQKHRDRIADEAQKLRNAVRVTSEKLNEAVSAKKENAARIAELEKVISGYETIDEELVRTQIEEASSERKTLRDKSTTAAAEIGTAEAALESINAGAAEIEKIRKRHEVVDSLFRTAAGTLTGKDKISLEAYVQAFYFDRIIRHANLRLMMMSGGQYEFIRSEEASNKRQKFGLGLNIIDHYTGSERPVSTLSGGESFMASLSLALGLSDEIQSSSGGIKLDTMFIDEGFGSLDGETLENAIRTLTQLADEDKLVGIISHVEALSSRIDKQIVVAKDRVSGSHITLKV